jgi:hypothetical protein
MVPFRDRRLIRTVTFRLIVVVTIDDARRKDGGSRWRGVRDVAVVAVVSCAAAAAGSGTGGT